jgi:hypothetical protein
MNFVMRASRRPRSLPIALLVAGTLAVPAVRQAQAQAALSSSASFEAPELPSGLSPISQLIVGGSQLALDSNGALFRLDDHGKRWKQIHQQWDGKAIELLGIPALTAAPGSGQAPKAEDDPELFAAVLLKSDVALHWVSVDRGKTWKPSTLDDVRRNDVKWSGAE